MSLQREVYIMSNQNIFKRREFKYLLTPQQKAAVMQAMEPHMHADPYGLSTIRNLYYDTDTYRLIRSSIERPVYKEKLRFRSYERLLPDEYAFVELKKKYASVVYKRRIRVPYHSAAADIAAGSPLPVKCQIADEINYFISFYENLAPKVFLSYDREAFYEKDNPDFRVTFDSNILCREDDLSLCSEIYGTPLLPENVTLMEIKTIGGIPLWMTHILTEERIYRSHYSKYGTAYCNIIYPKQKGALLYA